MRIALVSLVACTSSTLTEVPDGTVRQRLEAPTRVVLAPNQSTGSVEAQRWAGDGWHAGTAPLQLTSGELEVSTDPDGHIVVSDFSVGFAPIALPLGGAALSQVRLELVPPAIANTAWLGDDEATARVLLDLELAWSLTVDGNSAPLGDQHLPPISVALVFDGSGTAVDTSMALAAPGTFWSWAGLLELADLRLSLAGSTVTLE
jgi:hypothetical protein